LFRDLFIREGYHYDYVFDWTMVKFQEKDGQAAAAQANPLSAGQMAGLIANASGAPANDSQQLMDALRQKSGFEEEEYVCPLGGLRARSAAKWLTRW